MVATRSHSLPPRLGRVWLVGAGPGAADLITVRGQRILQAAEVVLYDDLANPELLDLCPASAERIHVGKRAGRHSASQSAICQLLVAKAKAGHSVVRLKGGDPMLLARMGEELEALTQAGIEFEIVPGVTAAAGAGAVAGIPLTQRGCASAVVFATGHLCADRSVTPVDWRALAASRATLCIYMGTQQFDGIAAELIAGGLPAGTGVAVIADATLPTQSVRFGTLAEGGALTHDERRRPALIIVGDVVRWSEFVRTARQEFQEISA